MKPWRGLVAVAVAFGLGSSNAFKLVHPISRMPKIATPIASLGRQPTTRGVEPYVWAPSMPSRGIVRPAVALTQSKEASATASTSRRRRTLLVKSVLAAVPVVVAALVVCLRPDSAAAAAQAAAQGAAEHIRVNKVRALLEQFQARAQELGAKVGLPVLTEGIKQGWTGPMQRYATPPAPGTPLGDALLRIQRHLPWWTPLQVTAFLSLMPFVEARVAVPLGVAMGAPWLKALAVGSVVNLAAIPVAAWLGAQVYYKANTEEWQQTVQASRETYRQLFQVYAQLEGQLGAKRAVLDYEEKHLRRGLDEAIAALCSGDVLLSLRAREDLLDDIVKGSAILLQLGDDEVQEFDAKLRRQALQGTVGDSLNEAEAFQEVTVAELGQRRVEAAWHPDLAILPEVGQQHTAAHLSEVAEQARVDFVERAEALKLLRAEVASLEKQVERARESYRSDGAEVVDTARSTLSKLKTVFDKETDRKKRQRLTDREQDALERAEEEAKVEALQAKGNIIMAYGWPNGVVNVGVPVPWGGVWTAMYLAQSVGMRVAPSAFSAGVGAVIAAAAGLGLSLAGWWGLPVYLLALLYRNKQGELVSGDWWADVMEKRRIRQAELRVAAEKAKKKEGGEEGGPKRRPA